MTIDKQAIFDAVLAQDPGWQTLVNDNWNCLNPDDRRRILILASGSSGGGLTGSEGGFDAADAGLAAIFGADGSLAATNQITIFEGVGHTNGVTLETSAINGERIQSFANASGVLAVLVDTIPANSDAAGVKGTYAVDGDYLYYYEHVLGKWRRCPGNLF